MGGDDDVSGDFVGKAGVTAVTKIVSGGPPAARHASLEEGPKAPSQLIILSGCGGGG